ncbi:MAG: hypothetical protein L0220_10570 [Acidobacteria bacterium]|nr:hypothetical protein [Acidobacteriota bacterium]
MFEHPSITPSNSLGTEASSYSSPSYNEAVNAARFVKGFGIAALAYSIGLLFGKVLGGGIGLGIGLFIMRYDAAKYYRVLGIIVMVFAVVGIFFPFIGPAILSGDRDDHCSDFFPRCGMDGGRDFSEPASTAGRENSC